MNGTVLPHLVLPPPHHDLPAGGRRSRQSRMSYWYSLAWLKPTSSSSSASGHAHSVFEQRPAPPSYDDAMMQQPPSRQLTAAVGGADTLRNSGRSHNHHHGGPGGHQHASLTSNSSSGSFNGSEAPPYSEIHLDPVVPEPTDWYRQEAGLPPSRLNPQVQWYNTINPRLPSHTTTTAFFHQPQYSTLNPGQRHSEGHEASQHGQHGERQSPPFVIPAPGAALVLPPIAPGQQHLHHVPSNEEINEVRSRSRSRDLSEDGGPHESRGERRRHRKKRSSHNNQRSNEAHNSQEEFEHPERPRSQQENRRPRGQHRRQRSTPAEHLGEGTCQQGNGSATLPHAIRRLRARSREGIVLPREERQAALQRFSLQLANGTSPESPQTNDDSRESRQDEIEVDVTPRSSSRGRMRSGGGSAAVLTNVEHF